MPEADANSTKRDRTGGPLRGLLTNRNYLMLWAAYGISAMGDHLSEMAVLKTQNATNRPDLTRLQAIMTFVFMAPFMLGPLTGWVADRLPRKWIMVSADVIRAVIMFNFALLIRWFAGRLEGTYLADWGPFLPLGIVGIFAACFAPARLAMVPTLVRTEQLVSANAMINALGIIGTTVAVVIGGHLANLTDSPYGEPIFSFRLDALTFLGSACCVLMIFPPRTHPRTSMKKAGVLESLHGGFRFARSHRPVLELIGIAVGFWFAASVVRSTIPSLATDVYGGQYSDIAYLQAGLVLGMVCGAGGLTWFGNTLRSEIAITWSYFLASVAVMGLAVSTTGLFGSRGMLLGFCTVLTVGVAGAGVMASMNALLQRVVPDHYRGRVFGVKDLCTMTALLVATGTLGIPHWPNIDDTVGWILLGIAGMLFAVGMITFVARIRRRNLGWVLGFLRGFFDFYAKWWWRYRREGLCTIPREGPVILAANHYSTVDPFVLTVSSPHRIPSFLMVASHYHFPVFKHVIRRAKCIPVRRDGKDTAAAKAAMRILKDGGMLGIFPEGGIPVPGERRDPKLGIALLAIRTGAKVVPAYISGTKYSKRYLPPLFWRHHARVRYGPPIDLSDYRDKSHDRETLQDAAEKIMREIRKLAPETAGDAGGLNPTGRG